MEIKPHETAIPLIIKPWHHATIRWNKKEKHWVATFEGAGYKKFLFTCSVKHFNAKLKALGFSQYKIKGEYDRDFRHVNLKKRSTDTDGAISWFARYIEYGLCVNGVRRY